MVISMFLIIWLVICLIYLFQVMHTDFYITIQKYDIDSAEVDNAINEYGELNIILDIILLLPLILIILLITPFTNNNKKEK